MDLAPPPLASEADYVRVLQDAAFWEPWVRAALDRAGLPPPRRVQAGRDNTYPTFLADTGVVVKLFGPWWAGPASHRAERAAYDRLRGADVPVPRLLAAGELFPKGAGWPWPYLVLERLAGTPYALREPGLPREARRTVARDLGALLRRLNGVPLAREGVLAASWDRFLTLLRRRRREAPEDHRRWGRLPSRLVDDLDGFLPRDPAVLVDRDRPPRFLHGDLHGEHVFLTPASGRVAGLVDFTDAIAGDVRYDLVALHLGTFRGDPDLLAACLDGYGLERGPGWPRAMLAFTLLHDFDVLAGVTDRLPLEEAEDLEALAALLWGREGGTLK